MVWMGVQGEQASEKAVADFRLALSRNDPAIGLPGGRRWIDELRKRLKNGSYKGDRANMGRMWGHS